MIPNEALKDNFKKSADSYNNVAPYHFYNGEKWNGIADNYADIILLNVAWHMGKGNPLAASIDTGYYDGGDGGTQRVDVGRALVGLFLYMGILGSVWYLFHKKEGKREASILLLLLGAVVFLRYLVLNNHSYLHEFFTYRTLAAPILASLLTGQIQAVTALWGSCLGRGTRM